MQVKSCLKEISSPESSRISLPNANTPIGSNTMYVTKPLVNQKKARQESWYWEKEEKEGKASLHNTNRDNWGKEKVSRYPPRTPSCTMPSLKAWNRNITFSTLWHQLLLVESSEENISVSHLLLHQIFYCIDLFSLSKITYISHHPKGPPGQCQFVNVSEHLQQALKEWRTWWNTGINIYFKKWKITCGGKLVTLVNIVDTEKTKT